MSDKTAFNANTEFSMIWLHDFGGHEVGWSDEEMGEGDTQYINAKNVERAIADIVTKTNGLVQDLTAVVDNINAAINQAVTDLLPVMSLTIGADEEDTIHEIVQQIANNLMGLIETEETAVTEGVS